MKYSGWIMMPWGIAGKADAATPKELDAVLVRVLQWERKVGVKLV